MTLSLPLSPTRDYIGSHVSHGSRASVFDSVSHLATAFALVCVREDVVVVPTIALRVAIVDLWRLLHSHQFRCRET